MEDFLGAGAIIDNFRDVTLSDVAQASLLVFCAARSSLLDAVREGSHAKYLIPSASEDVEFCSQLDRYAVVPYLKGDRVVALKP